MDRTDAALLAEATGPVLPLAADLIRLLIRHKVSARQARAAWTLVENHVSGAEHAFSTLVLSRAEYKLRCEDLEAEGANAEPAPAPREDESLVRGKLAPSLDLAERLACVVRDAGVNQIEAMEAWGLAQNAMASSLNTPAFASEKGRDETS